MNIPSKVSVYEVGPRDGLQNEGNVIPTEAKVRFINMLSAAGLGAIEATAFVSPRAIPQLADASNVVRAINRSGGIRYPVLVPNERGMERALEAGAREVAVFTAASESFTRANINSTISESLANFRAVLRLAERERVSVRGYVSTAFGCPYEGAVPPARVVEVAGSLLEMGAYEVSVGDTIGVATPLDVEERVGLLLEVIPAGALALHFHDTRGTALANVLQGLQMGITTFDAAAGGLGGCPYAPGASGNLATEDLLYMLHGMNIETGVDLEKVCDASEFILGMLGKLPPSKYLQAVRRVNPAVNSSEK